MDDVQQTLPPRTKTLLRSFLELCNVYRRFVTDFPSIVTPLNKKLKKTASDEYHFTDVQTKSFEELKDHLTSPFVLVLPRADKPIVVDTDFNAEQCGCFLLQEQDEDSLRSAPYFNRTLKDGEQNYDTTEREWLAIMFPVLMLRLYL